MKTLTNQIIQWLLEQNDINNHLFKTRKEFNEYLKEDICEETIRELTSKFNVSIAFINELVMELITAHTSNDGKQNKFLEFSINPMVKIITVTYSLKPNQSYTRHETVAKKKLKDIVKANGLYNTQLWFKHVVRVGSTNKYIFTYEV